MSRGLGRDVLIYGSGELLYRGAQFAVLPLYANSLSVSDFGLMTLLSVSITLVGMCINLGINNAVQRFYFDTDLSDSDRADVVSTGLIQLLSVGFTTVLFGAVLLFFFHEPIEASYGITPLLAAIALATVVPEQVVVFVQDVIRLHFAPVRYMIVSIIRGLVGVLIGIALLRIFDLGVAGILLGTLLGSLLAIPIAMVAIRRELHIRFNKPLWRDLFRFGYPYVITGSAYWLFGSIDRWMLASISSMEQAGLLSVGMKFASIVAFASFAFGRAWSPFAFRLQAEDPAYRLKIARIMSAWCFLLSMVGLTVSLGGHWLLRVFTPPEYWAAAPVLSVTAGAIVLDGTTLVTAMGMVFGKRPGLMAYGAWLAAAANFLMNLLLIPHFGAVGASFATFAAYCTLTGSFMVMSQHVHRLPLEYGKLGYCAVLVATTLVAPFFLPENIALRAAVIAVALAGGLLFKVLDISSFATIMAKPGITKSGG